MPQTNQLEDIPSVRAGLEVPKEERGQPGIVVSTGKRSEPVELLVKYLVLAVVNDPDAMATVFELEIAVIDDEHGLWFKAQPEDIRAFSLLLWEIPKMRAVFDTLGLAVLEGGRHIG